MQIVFGFQMSVSKISTSTFNTTEVNFIYSAHYVKQLSSFQQF